MKKITIISLMATAVFFSSCLKDDVFGGEQYGIGESGVQGIGFKNPEYNLAISSDPTPQAITSVIVGINAAKQPTSDVSYTIVSTPSLVPAGVTVLPAGAFTIATPGTVRAGQYFDTLEVFITNASLLDPTQTYGIGLTVSSAGAGYTIQGNGNTTLITFNVKNKYDGVYDYRGYALRAGDNVLTGYFRGLERSLITNGANSVIMDDLLAWANGSGIGIGEPTFVVDPATNLVTVTSSGGAINLPGYVNKYDPATKTFFIGVTWGAGPAARQAIDTLVYTGPRP